MSRTIVRRETLALGDGGSPFRILFASDLHLGLPWTRRVPETLARVVETEKPDVTILGGDLVDGRRGLDSIERCIARLGVVAPVVAIPGNHDVRTGVDSVRSRVIDAGGAWLPDGARVFGRARGRAMRFTSEAAPHVAGVATDAVDKTVDILCAHHPDAAESAAACGFTAAFAGHLHGGQCVWFRRKARLYPGAWFSRWNGLRFDVGALRLFVSLGLGDTLPLRFNCPRDVIVCDVV